MTPADWLQSLCYASGAHFPYRKNKQTMETFSSNRMKDAHRQIDL